MSIFLIKKFRVTELLIISRWGPKQNINFQVRSQLIPRFRFVFRFSVRVRMIARTRSGAMVGLGLGFSSENRVKVRTRL